MPHENRDTDDASNHGYGHIPYTPFFPSDMEKSPTQAPVQFHKAVLQEWAPRFQKWSLPVLWVSVGPPSGLPFQSWMLCSNITSQKSAQSLSRTHSRSQWSFPHRIHAVHTSHTRLGFHLHTKVKLGSTVARHCLAIIKS